VITRRAFVAGAGAALVTAACADPSGERGVVRIGLLSSLSHAPVLAGLATGRIAKALAPVEVESRVFRAGPRVVEALAGLAIDFGVSGPAPVVISVSHHGADALRVTSGCASGGASLVVAREANIARASDLRGKSLAVTQLGSTQDVSLRKYLRAHGLEATTRGGGRHDERARRVRHSRANDEGADRRGVDAGAVGDALGARARGDPPRRRARLVARPPLRQRARGRA
jgi:NitT/TauT family transport system substrate-binding protein